MGDGEPLDSDLWTSTRAAIDGVAIAADAYLERSGWYPRVNLPTLERFDSGWPSLRRPFSAPDDAPPDYFGLFGEKRGQVVPIAYTDVAELIHLRDFVRTRTDLMARLWPEGLNEEHGDVLTRLIDWEIYNLPISILARARATGSTTNETLQSLYLEREREWLLDRLPVEYVVPLALTGLDLDESLAIEDNTRIEPLAAASQLARTPDRHTLANVPDPVISAATHAIVSGGHELSNPGPIMRAFASGSAPSPPADIDLVCDGLRVITGEAVGYAQVLYRPIGWAYRWEHDLPPVEQLSTFRRYPETFDDFGWLKTPRLISRESLLRLPTVIPALRASNSNVRLATRRLSQASLRDSDDDRTLDACIGIEALLGEGRDELSHRIALRAAVVLATRAQTPLKPRATYTLTKRVYSHRSAVVHGDPGDKTRTITFEQRAAPASHLATLLLRWLIFDVLTRPGGWTAKELDSKLLDAIEAFSFDTEDDTDGPAEGTGGSAPG